METNKTWSYKKISIVDEEITSEGLESEADYVRVEVSASDESNKKVMHDNHYICVDRTVKAKILLASLEGLGRLVRMDVRELKDISEEVYIVAQKAFKTDRRFFLDINCDEALGHYVLRDYIRQFQDVEKMVLGCFYKEQLVGTLIAIKISDTEYETVLGAILPEWQAKGAGVSLYAYEFTKLQEKGIKMLYSRISTNNVASLNLHMSLSKGNISFMQPFDIYIKAQ